MQKKKKVPSPSAHMYDHIYTTRESFQDLSSAPYYRRWDAQFD